MKRAELLPQRNLVRMSVSMERAIDRWRARQEDVPTRAEAVRRLVEIAIALAKEGKLKHDGCRDL